MQITPLKMEFNLHNSKIDGIEVYWCFTEEYPSPESCAGSFINHRVMTI